MLLPVVVGAILALLASWLVTTIQIRRQEQAERERRDYESTIEYEKRIVDSLIRFMEALGDLSARLDMALNLSTTTLGANGSLENAREIEVRADTFWMIARERDIEVAKSLKYAIGRIVGTAGLSEQARDLRVTGQILRAWRNGSLTIDIAIERLTGLAAREGE